MMRFVHPLVGVREIEGVASIRALTRGYGEWAESEEADVALTRLWLAVADRLTSSGAADATVDVCGGGAEPIRNCPGWRDFPTELRGPWSSQFVEAVAETGPCWLEVWGSDTRTLLVMDGGLDRMVVVDGGVDLSGVLEAAT